MGDLNLEALKEFSETAIDVSGGVMALTTQLAEYRDKMQALTAKAANYTVKPDHNQTKRELVILLRESVHSLDMALAALGAK